MSHRADPAVQSRDRGGPGVDRECVGTEGQACPTDEADLVCLTDYIGGGSHYWHLQCPTCQREFTYDTHRFLLEPWMVWTGSTWVVA